MKKKGLIISNSGSEFKINLNFWGFVYWAVHFGVFLFLFFSYGKIDSLSSFCFADCHWYERIVSKGYYFSPTESNLVFFPLYPWLAKILALVGLESKSSLVLISWVFSFLLWQMLSSVVQSSKYRHLFLLSFFVYPASFVIYLGYTESIFLFLSLVFYLKIKAIFYLDRSHPAFGRSFFYLCLIAGLVSLTRLNGVFLPLACLFFTKHLIKKLGIRNFFTFITSALLPLVVFYGYGIYLTHSLSFFKSIQVSNWGHSIVGLGDFLRFDILCSFLYDKLVFVMILFLFFFFLVRTIFFRDSKSSSLISLWILTVSLLNITLVFASKGGAANFSGAARYLLIVYIFLIYKLILDSKALTKHKKSLFVWSLMLMLFNSVFLNNYLFKIAQQVYFEDPWLIPEAFFGEIRQSLLNLYFMLLCG